MHLNNKTNFKYFYSSISIINCPINSIRIIRSRNRPSPKYMLTEGSSPLLIAKSIATFFAWLETTITEIIPRITAMKLKTVQQMAIKY